MPLTFGALPTHDLAVQPEASLLLDSGTHLFIRPATAATEGADGDAAPADPLADVASRLALLRDPPARVLRADGAAGAAALLAQLQPSRREPPQRPHLSRQALRRASCSPNSAGSCGKPVRRVWQKCFLSKYFS